MSAPASRQAAQLAQPDDRKIATEGQVEAAQRLVYDEMADIFDFLESFAVGGKEACRRADSVRVPTYAADVGRCLGDLREAWGRISALGKLEGPK